MPCITNAWSREVKQAPDPTWSNMHLTASVVKHAPDPKWSNRRQFSSDQTGACPQEMESKFESYTQIVKCDQPDVTSALLHLHDPIALADQITWRDQIPQRDQSYVPRSRHVTSHTLRNLSHDLVSLLSIPLLSF
jgi:hypothetical protein